MSIHVCRFNIELSVSFVSTRRLLLRTVGTPGKDWNFHIVLITTVGQY